MRRSPFVVGSALVAVPLGILLLSAAGGSLTSAQASCGQPSSTPIPAGQLGMGGMVRWLEAQGIAPNGAAGIVGNAQQENGLSPVMNSGGLGLFQWVGGRIGDVQAYASAHGLNVESDEAQLGFLIQDLRGPYSALLTRLNAEPTPQQAADDFEAVYERAGIPMLANRERYAVQALQQAGGATVVGSAPLSCTAVSIGGLTNPFAHVPGYRPGRVDMGVDGAGDGPVVALGSGMVYFSSTSSGWPGAGFLGVKLTDGRSWYIAEHFIPSVRVGDQVQAGQVVGTMTSGGIETGWALGPPTDLAYAHAEWAGHDSNANSTAAGVNFNDLLKALGCPTMPPAAIIIGQYP